MLLLLLLLLLMLVTMRVKHLLSLAAASAAAAAAAASTCHMPDTSASHGAGPDACELDFGSLSHINMTENSGYITKHKPLYYKT